MSRYEFECETTSQVAFDKIADAFANTSSNEQAVFLQELFDALLHKCGDHHKMRMQIKYISSEINVRNFKQAQIGVRMLQEEIEPQNTEPVTLAELK